MALALGSYYLVAAWQAFNMFAVNRALPRPPGWDPEIMFWYTLPGFEAGLLAGIAVTTARQGIVRWLRVVCVVVWAELAVNFCIVVVLAGTGALF
jgi:hypothetical protein